MSDQDRMPQEIAAAIVQAQRHIKSVGHDAKNTHHRFTYTTTESLIRAGREALNSAGLALISEGWSTDMDGRSAWHREQFLLVHESGATWRPAPVGLPAEEGKGMPMDKAILGADTTIHGYFLRSLLQIDRPESEDDVSGRDDSDYQPVDRRQDTKPLTPEEREGAIAGIKDAAIRMHTQGRLRGAMLDSAYAAAERHGVDRETVRSWLAGAIGRAQDDGGGQATKSSKSPPAVDDDAPAPPPDALTAFAAAETPDEWVTALKAHAGWVNESEKHREVVDAMAEKMGVLPAIVEEVLGE